ncbi:MAG: oxygenase MpaB family protein [Acidimicrobiales bacterium]
METTLRQVAAVGWRAGALGGQLALAPLQVPLAVADALLAPVRSDVRCSVRRALGVPGKPPPCAADPEHAFLPPDGVARRVHGDLPSMVVGGLAALMLQTLHPLAMAGVADHSNYREDAIGRLRRTANFVGVTTFGTMEEASRAIEQVRRVHRHVTGTAPDGRHYAAGDPELLTWVHVAEMWSFLQAAQRYGPDRLTPAECDHYLAETAGLARALGARWVPESVDEVSAYFGRVRPELYAGPQAMDARDFLLRGVGTRPNDRAVYALVVAAAMGLLPRWARRQLRLAPPPVIEPLLDGLVVAPLGRAFCAAVRWTVAPPASTGSE